jgi:hypothetical protein
MFELILFLFGLAVIVGVAANTRGRHGVGWFLLSLIISPILTGLLLFVLPKHERQLRRSELLRSRKCPHCHSIMPATAPVCAKCTRESTPISEAEIAAVKQQVRAF